MKKDKEWLKNEVEDYLAIEGVYDARTALKAVLEYIDQLDEPEQEKVVVNEIMAGHIENCKNLKLTLSDSLHLVVPGDKQEEVLFARAWLDGYTIEPEPMYLVKVNDQGSCLYLKSMQLYKDVESRTDLNSNFEAWKEKAIKFTNKEQAEGIAKFFNGEVVEVMDNV